MGCGASQPPPPPVINRKERRLTVTQGVGVIPGAQSAPVSKFEQIRYSFQSEGCDTGSVEGVGNEGGVSRVLSYAAVSHAGYDYTGKKKTNQDRFLVTPNFLSSTEKALFGVFDGHGSVGHDASQYIIQTVPELAARKLKNLDDNSPFDQNLITEALKYTFVECDRMMNEKSGIDVNLSGATAVMIFQRGLDLGIANAGDSRAVLARMQNGSLINVDLSQDNKPEDPDEKRRIESMGGYCEPLFDEEDNEFVGPCRVWSRAHNGRMPGIAMSRSLGDKIATDCGVIPEPVVEFFSLDLSTDQFIIVASDGVWEFITSQEAVTLAAEHTDPREMAERLCTESLNRWRAEEDVVDDISCVIVRIHGDRA
jgi:serine/threonine protein phosphatase PrpC